MFLFKDITSAIKLNEVEREKQFYEILTATVSHEMKTPLNSILNSSEQLEQYIPKDNPGAIKLRRINYYSSRLLLSLVNDLLDLF